MLEAQREVRIRDRESRRSSEAWGSAFIGAEGFSSSLVIDEFKT